MLSAGPGAAVAAPAGHAREGAPTPALRIVYLWDADYPWDVRTEKVCAALTARGHDVHIIARNTARRPVVERRPEGTVHRMRPWRWLPERADALLGFPLFLSPRWLSLLTTVVRENRPHVIIARDLPLCPAAILVGRRTGVPIILDMAENYPAVISAIWEAGRQRPLDVLVRNPSIVAAVERYCIRRVDRILVVAEEARTRLEGMGVPRDRIDVVLNTPPRARAQQAATGSRSAPGAPLVVVYLGLLEIVRGIGDLIAAAAILRDRGRPVRIRLAGNGRDMALFQAQAASLGLTERDVEFLGFLPNDRALEIVAAADIGANPLHDGEKHDTCVPNKLFDYMAASLPVLTSDTIPSARIVRETKCGEVFRARDAQSLADALERLADPEVRAAEGRAGRIAVLERYHWERDCEVLSGAVARVTSDTGHSRTRGNILSR